jgi:hypothetical protein
MRAATRAADHSILAVSRVEVSVKRLMIVLAVIVGADGGSALMAAQCEPFSIRPGCATRARPQFQVDFGAARFKPTKPANAPKAEQAPARFSHRPTGIDCAMVIQADSAIDPKIVSVPPSNVQHSLRIVRVPGCPDKE